MESPLLLRLFRRLLIFLSFYLGKLSPSAFFSTVSWTWQSLKSLIDGGEIFHGYPKWTLYMAIDCLTEIISRPVRCTPVDRKQHVRETGLSGNIIAMKRPPESREIGVLGAQS